MSEDPFDGLLSLEETFYQEGYQLGLEDGFKSGRIEGRTFGVEKGFEKFLAMGRLRGQSSVLAARLSGPTNFPSMPETKEPLSSQTPRGTAPVESDSGNTVPMRDSTRSPSVRLLPNNPRLEKNVRLLHALVQSDDLPISNTEEALNDFDDRMRQATAKIKVIERLLGGEKFGSDAGEGDEGRETARTEGQRVSEGNIEDLDTKVVRR